MDFNYRNNRLYSYETDGKITSTEDILAGAIVIYDAKLEMVSF